MNVLDTLADLLDTEARIAALDARKAELRKALADKAAAIFATDGAAPTWRVPGMGTASWSGAGKTEAVVTDPQTYGEWVAESYPTEAELEVRIPAGRVHDPRFDRIKETLFLLASGSGMHVQPAFTARLLKSGANLGGQLVTDDGTVVPGVVVADKRPYLSVRLSAEAKARALAAVAAPSDLESAYLATRRW